MIKFTDKPKDNRGFSLVELIIVMVIMAILVGVVGTQVIPYIEKARRGKDYQIVCSYCMDTMTAYTSSAAVLDETEIYTITVSKGAPNWTVNVVDSGGTVNTVLKDAFLEMNQLDTDAPDFQSKEGKKIQTITIVCKSGKPSVHLTVSGPTNPAEFTVNAN